MPLIELSQVVHIGSALRRPECVLCLSNGDVVASHLGSGAIRIAPDGTQYTIGSLDIAEGKPFIPNGIAIEQDGSLLVANMGESGGLWRIRPDGAAHPVLTEIEDAALGATNFVLVANPQQTFVTVTTRQWPISKAFYAHEAAGKPDGMVIVIDRHGARILADDLCFANELRIDPDGTHLYVAETFARRISRYPLLSPSSLGPKETFIEFPNDVFPDGIAFDSDRHLWVASIISNRIVRVSPDRQVSTVLEENVEGHAERVAARLSSRALAREDVTESPAKVLRNPSSIAFGGADLKTVHVGSLSGDSLITFRSPVAGHALSHCHRR
jgi:sugar lactone lactonase YvrE